RNDFGGSLHPAAPLPAKIQHRPWESCQGLFPLNATLQKQRARHQSAPRCDYADARVRNLAFAALAPKLARAFDHVTDGVQPPAREAPTMRVRRDRAADRDVSVGDKRTSLTFRTEAEILEPAQREPAESVVQLRYVDVGWFQAAAAPQVLAAILRGHER